MNIWMITNNMYFEWTHFNINILTNQVRTNKNLSPVATIIVRGFYEPVVRRIRAIFMLLHFWKLESYRKRAGRSYVRHRDDISVHKSFHRFDGGRPFLVNARRTRASCSLYAYQCIVRDAHKWLAKLRHGHSRRERNFPGLRKNYMLIRERP